MTAYTTVVKATPAGLGPVSELSRVLESGCVMHEENTSSQNDGADIPQADPIAAVTRWHPSPFGRAWRYESTLNAWAKGIADCEVAVTVTFGTGRGSAATSPSERTVEEIVRKAIRWANTQVYGNGFKRKGYAIGSVTAFEGTGQFERLHAHIAFEPPSGMSFQQFSLLVGQAFKPSKWIEQRPHIKECWSEDWMNYTLKLGQEALVPSCCFTAKHPVA